MLAPRYSFRPEIKTLPLVEEEGDFEKEKEMEHLDDLYAAIKNGDLLVFNSVVEGMDESSFASIRFYVMAPLKIIPLCFQIIYPVVVELFDASSCCGHSQSN